MIPGELALSGEHFEDLEALLTARRHRFRGIIFCLSFFAVGGLKLGGTAVGSSGVKYSICKGGCEWSRPA